MISDNCKDKDFCLKSHCLSERTAYIYGLYDVRLYDIFYVGSTFYPSKRFSDHLQRATTPYNYKSLWLQNILESGSYPLPILLYEFQTMCDNYTRHIENEIAAQVRAEGHTAICDWYGCPSEIRAYFDTLPEPREEELSRTEIHTLVNARLTLHRSLELVWIERIAEQAQVQRMLKEMFEAS